MPGLKALESDTRAACAKRVYDVYRLIQKYNKLVAKLSLSFFFKYIEKLFSPLPFG